MNPHTRDAAEYMLDAYGAEPEYPWAKSPRNAIWRHPRTRKWFAVLLGQLPLRCLGLGEDGVQDVLNLKCDPIMTFSLVDNRRIFRAYHMNKEHWISVRLDGSVPMEELQFLVDMSWKLVDSAGRKSKRRHEDETE